MTSQATLNTNASNSTPLSISSEQPKIGSLTVTDILNENTLQGPEKSSADAMQTLQMQQTQPVIVPTLSPSRVDTSIADDLDALLDETLEEFCMRDTSSSSSTVQLTATSSLASVLNENGFHVGFLEQCINMEGFLVKVAELGIAVSLGAVDLMSSFMKGSPNDTAEIIDRTNKTIEMINLCFKSLLQSDNPSAWLEKESKTPFYQNCHLFAASYFLITTIDQEPSLLDLLDSKLIAEWKHNYQECIVLLKKYGLDQYNETEFPFSWMGKLTLNMTKALLSNDVVKNVMTEMRQNPQLVEMAKKDMRAFESGDPMAKMAKMVQNPQFAEMMQGQMGAFGNGDPMAKMAEMVQNPQFAEMMKAFGNGEDLMAMMAGMDQNPQQMGATGKGGFVGNEQMLNQHIPTFISFFQKLDQVLTQNPENAKAVEEWLEAEALKSTCQYPFFRCKSLLMRLPVDELSEKDPSKMLNSLFESCCQRLSALGLQKYVDEALPKQAIDVLKQMAVIQKDHLQLELSKCLSFLRPLSIELKQLDFTQEEYTANSQVVEDWMTTCKKTESYYAPFVTGLDLCEYREAFEGVLDNALLDELNQLLPFCRDRLLKLGLSTYVFEMPQVQGSTDDIFITPKKNSL